MDGESRGALDPATMFDLSGKVALVTGARRGIGLAMAHALAGAGADIIGVSAQLEESGSEVARRVQAAGRRFTGFSVDLADRAAVEELANDLAERTAPIDILVNNAGTITRTPALDHDTSTWERILEVNLTAPFLLARALGRGMVQRGYGKMIFTASLLSFQGGVLVPSYAAAKSGISGLVKALANEWAPHGVNVNAIAPGYIATDNTEALREDPTRNRAILDRIPAGRWGLASDLAGATVFLASSASDYVCGTIIAVDGGWLAR
jgi:2-dehydro-3-deoxy-D-gluconate 5-dehydrogenase